MRTAPRLVCASQGKSIVRCTDRAALLATRSTPSKRAERPIDLLSIVSAPGERPGLGGEAQVRPSNGRPLRPGKRPRRAAHPAGRVAASKRCTGHGAMRKAGPAGSTATPPFFLFFFAFSFTSLLVVCLDGLQNWPISKTFCGLLFSPILFPINKYMY
jgi:hypothetical protein